VSWSKSLYQNVPQIKTLADVITHVTHVPHQCQQVISRQNNYSRCDRQTDRHPFNGLFSRTTWISWYSKCDFIVISVATFRLDLTSCSFRQYVKISLSTNCRPLKTVGGQYGCCSCTTVRIPLNAALIMVALCNRADHYIFALLFMAALCNREGHIHFHPVVSFYLTFFPRLISAATDWMSTILLHMA